MPVGLLVNIYYCPCRDDNDDINDVATMGGVNLSEESKNILATNSELIGSQIRSCQDKTFLPHDLLMSRIAAIGGYKCLLFWDQFVLGWNRCMCLCLELFLIPLSEVDLCNDILSAI